MEMVLCPGDVAAEGNQLVGAASGHCPPPPDLQGGEVHALRSGLKLRGSATKAAVSAGVGA